MNPRATLTETERVDLARRVETALEEDLGDGDLTSRALVPDEATAEARIVARRPGILAGLPAAEEVFRRVDPVLLFESLASDGERIEAGRKVARIAGRARSLLAGERTALNFLQRLSGVATLTRRFADAVEGTGARILDTRKTLPGMRRLDKYAVRAGGGSNHRMGLFDQILIKENHLAASGLEAGGAVERAREKAPSGTFVEVEVETLQQFRRALEAGPDAILLDDMGREEIAEAVRLRGSARTPALEVSGGVSLETVRGLAELGVDRISVGALTHSAPALDLALEMVLP